MIIKEKDITICGHGSGTPRTTSLETYNASRYNQTASSNGKRKQVVAVRRLKSMTDPLRIKFHDTYKTILKRNKYNQNLRLYCYKTYTDGLYYSDCSSSICLTYSKIGLTCSALNTAGIYNSSLFEDVPVKIVNGHITNPEILKVGDCLLYVGNDASRPLQIGHVEAVYEIAGSADSGEDSGLKTLSYTPIAIKSTGTKGITPMAELNIRSLPSTQGKILGTIKETFYPTIRTVVNNVGWFKVGNGWVSAKYCYGWIQDTNNGWWYLLDKVGYDWYKECFATIDDKVYAFKKNGYMLTKSDISDSGEINNK